VTRVRARVTGVVQGVGFRPYVHRLARDHGLSGWVRNDSEGVLLELQGAPDAVEGFLARLPHQSPPMARVADVEVQTVPAGDGTSFEILHSVSGAEPLALVAPDAATCDDCLAELFDPGDRRFRYPFINCTNCGPRFSIIRGIPYDRPLTTMSGFRMCTSCQAEYDDPGDRRFHAQANACWECGPTARLLDTTSGEHRIDRGADAVAAAGRALLDGDIVAVKGIGGYHLVCRADSEEAVATLRSRKRRDDKPLAVMAPDLDVALTLIELSREAEELLCASERPIVIAPRRPSAPIAVGVAPWTRELGVLLPYSPLHHLLLAATAMPLVMTSGNPSDEPIAHEDADAVRRLGAIADRVLAHDRPIHVPGDDSVLRAMPAGRHPVLIRRSRGYVPDALRLPVAAQVPILACGGDVKSTFCVAKGGRAWVGPHIGDLSELKTLRSYTEGIAHFERLFAVTPQIVAHDSHPDFRSTAYAAQRTGVATMAIQHHHAHLAACLAEHDEAGPAVAAIYDGSGHGLDGTVWGGELLVGGLRDFRRAGHLRTVRMPGGERAVRQPWRMACSWLVESLDTDPEIPAPLARAVDERHWRAAVQLSRTGLASPLTSSVGRLFDAVAALCGVRAEVRYEGQAAIELEAVCDEEERSAYPLAVCTGADHSILLDPRATVRAVIADVAAGTPAGLVAARFHVAVAQATATALEHLADRLGIRTVVLSGGVFANRRLLGESTERLEAAGLRVLVPRRLPPNDGGLAYGQAAIAAALGADHAIRAGV